MEIVESSKERSNKKQTTITIQKELHTRLILYCMLKKVSCKDFVKEAIEQRMKQDAITAAIVDNLQKIT